MEINNWHRTLCSTEKKTDFTSHVAEILPKLVNKSICRIMGAPIGNRPYEHFGTGVLIRYQDNLCVITADHVLNQVSKDESQRKIAISCFPTAQLIQTYRYPAQDVAVLVLEHLEHIAEEKEYWDGQHIDTACSTLLNDYFLIQGYPARLQKYLALGPVFFTQSYTHFSSIRLSQNNLSSLPLEQRLRIAALLSEYPLLPKDFLEPFQIPLNFANVPGPLMSTTDKEISDANIIDDHAGLFYAIPTYPGQKPFGPDGLSGSPVWRVGANESNWEKEAWSAGLTNLVGIVTHWSEKHQVLLVTPIAKVLSDIFSR